MKMLLGLVNRTLQERKGPMQDNMRFSLVDVCLLSKLIKVLLNDGRHSLFELLFWDVVRFLSMSEMRLGETNGEAAFDARYSTDIAGKDYVLK